MPFHSGNKVRVHPLGDDKKVAHGTVVIASKNQRSIAIGFEDEPPFLVSGGGIAYHPVHGIMLLVHREIIDGFEEPWTEMFAGGQFEILPEES